MIINTGSRTDIPAYYSEWFYNRIKDKYVLVRNPYYPTQILRYRLTPDVVDAICFCTKNPEPMFAKIKNIEAFRQVWYVTITPYGTEIEPNVPNKENVMESLCKLADIVGVSAVIWRYDPIFITDTYSVDVHIRNFEQMAKYLSGSVNTCVISFIDLYEKTKRNFPGVKEVTRQEGIQIGKTFAEIGKKYGIQIRSCCEGAYLEPYGVDVSGCMTQSVIEQAIGCNLKIPKNKKPAREACNCLLGNDIGAYNTCGHGCLYCYANYDRKTVTANMKLHNPNSSFLIGDLQEGDIIKDAKQESYADGQMTFTFDSGNEVICMSR